MDVLPSGGNGGYHNKVSCVNLIHAETKVTAFKAFIPALEDGLELDKRVEYKPRFKEKENVASEVLKSMTKLGEKDDGCKGIIVVSQRLCEVMKNNKEMAQAFEEIIMQDLDRSREEHRFALLWTEDVTPAQPIFTEAFSPQFVLVNENRTRIKCTNDETNVRQLRCFVQDILKQWLGPNAQLETGSAKMEESDEDVGESAIEAVRIIHGGAKHEVREIGRELEDGFELEETAKYMLYHRVPESRIPEIVLEEIRNVIEKDGRNTLGVITWCPKLLRIMKNSQLGMQFEDLLLAGARRRLPVVHLCVGVNVYEIRRHFRKLTQEESDFIPITIQEDQTIDVADLTKRVNLFLSQRNRRPTEDVYNFTGMEDKAASPPRNPENQPQNPCAGDRNSSEISEPRALASAEGQKPQQMRAMPFGHLRPSLGLVGNPSNQNQQGGRVVPSACNSHSTTSAGYTADEGAAMAGRPSQRKPRVHGQPSDDSNSGEGSGDQNYKYITNNGESWNNAPSGYAIDPQSFSPGMEQLAQGLPSDGHVLPGRPAETNNVWSARKVPAGNGPIPPQSSSTSPSSAAPSRVYTQATPSQPSSGHSKYLADGDHSMSITSMPSHEAFGSREPVLPTRDTTVESMSGIKSSSSGIASSNQHIPPGLQPNTPDPRSVGATCQSLPPDSQYKSVGTVASLGPATNKWAPSDFPSTEMQYNCAPRPNEAAQLVTKDNAPARSSTSSQREKIASLNPQSHSLDYANHSASKFPRRMNSGGISCAESPAAASSYFHGHSTNITPSTDSCNQMDHSQVSQSQLPSLLASTAYSSLPMASTPAASQSANESFAISGLASRLAIPPSSSQETPFVQCTVDNNWNMTPSLLNGNASYAHNHSSVDAFKQQDDREFGAGRVLPNQGVSPEFMSLPAPAAGQRVGNENMLSGERTHTSPGRMIHPPYQYMGETIVADCPLPDYLIKDMDYNCRQILKYLLDPETNTGCDWKVFAHHYKMKFEMVRFLQSSKKESQTHELLNWLTQYHPDVTCGMFKQVARDSQRMDVVRKMTKFGY